MLPFSSLWNYPIFMCSALVTIYVCSLYIWRSKYYCDHPETIKRRFISVFFMTVISLIFVYYGIGDNQSFLEAIGVRIDGIISACVLPLVLTMILFLGPLVLHYLDGVCSLYFDRSYWRANLKNIIWLRNHLVAPFSEELTFRACMIPILKQHYSDTASILICPVFFGIAHLHHIIDRLKLGYSLKYTLSVSVFQLLYTTLFGIYSAFLFVRTGHFVAPFIVHAFCNHMGFPDFEEALAYEQPKRSILCAIFVLGLISWGFLLFPLTEPHLYGQTIL